MFSFITLPDAVGTPGQLATLSFTSPISGTGVIRGRGWCNLTGGAADNGINIVGTSAALANAFTGVAFQDMAISRVTAGSPAAVAQRSFSTENTIAVTANTATTVILAARREAGTAAANCSGSLQVEVFGALP